MSGYEPVKYIVKQRAKRKSEPDQTFLRTNDIEEARAMMAERPTFYIVYTETGLEDFAAQPKPIRRNHYNNRTTQYGPRFTEASNARARASSHRKRKSR